MKNKNSLINSDVDVYVVQKQTTVERYAVHSDLERDSQTSKESKHAHDEHIKSRNILIENLKSLGLNYKIFNLDQLKESDISFYDEKNPSSGLQPKKKLVISLGGDGTLLHASHHVGGDVQLLGINSCPDHSIGHMCSTKPSEIESVLKKIIHKNLYAKSVRRLKVKVANSHKLNTPLALNDILFCNRHPAATSRYQIFVIDKVTGKEIETEKQLSSGLWIASAAGSTAAIASYGFSDTNLTSSDIFIATREPYTPHRETLKLKKFSIDGNAKELSFFSRMRQGIVCVDGPDFYVQFGFGEIVEVSLPEDCSILLF